MSLLKPIHKMSMLIFYEQLFIQIFHHNGNLITEQGTGEQNPLFQLAIDSMLTSTTWKQKQMNTPPPHSNQFQLFHNSNNNTDMYIIHFSIELTAFSAEYALSTTIVILSNLYVLFNSKNFIYYSVTVTRCCSYSCFVLLKMGDNDSRNM